MSRKQLFLAKYACANFKVKNQTASLFQSCVVVRRPIFGMQLRPKVKKKRYAGIFKFLIFWGQKYIACGEKTLKNGDFHHKRCIIDPKNQKFENSRITFFFHLRAKLHTKNGPPNYYTALEKWGGSFFTLKFAYAYFA